MKHKAIYILAFFLIASGSFFGYYMRNQNKQNREWNKPIIKIHEMAKPQKKEESMVVVATDAEAPSYVVRSVGDQIIIYAGENNEEVCRMPFFAERLHAKEKDLLIQGIAAQTREEALMIAEAFIN